MTAPFRLPTRAPIATEAQWENLRFGVGIGIALCLVYPGVLLAMGDATGAKVVIGTMTAIVLAYALARRLNNFLLGVNLIVFAAYCGVMIQTARQGGLEAPTLMWLVTGPALSIICAAYRSAIVWLVLGLASLLALGLLEYRGVKLPVEAATDNIPFRTSVIFGLFVALASFFGIVDRARRRSLSALEAANQALSAAKVALEVRNDELQTAHRAALLAATAKSRFLATISHEIRTPLNGVIGATQVLAMGAMSPHQQNLVSTLAQSGEALLELIDNVLDYAKLEAGKVEIASRAFSPREIVEGVGALFAAQAAVKGLELTCRVAPTVAEHVDGDSARLRQILSNLVSNAIKFTARGGVTLEVTQAEDEFCYEVSDTGMGIPHAQQAILFSPFTQLDDSVTRTHGGTGLGLAISHELAALMGGGIELLSVAGEGTLFRCRIPLRPLAARESPHPPALAAREMRLWVAGPTGAITHELAAAADLNVTRLAARPTRAELAAFARAQTLLVIDGRTIDPTFADSLRTSQCPTVVLLRVNENPTSFEDLGTSIVACYLPLQRDKLWAACHTALNGGATPPRMCATTPNLSAVVLVVEDNPVNLALVTAMLDHLGCVVITACDGAEALAKFEAGRFDLILMDCHMPVLDGYGATRAIRQREQSDSRSRTRIIALTADVLTTNLEHCQAAGMDGYLSKPFTLDQLHAIVLSPRSEFDPARSLPQPATYSTPHTALAQA